MILEEINYKLLLLDGMFIETGGQYTGESTIKECIQLTKEYISNSENSKNAKSDILEIIEYYINLYIGEVEWKYYDRMMLLLNELKKAVLEM